MIIFLYGQDTYRSKRKLREIVSSYKEKHPKGLDLMIYDLAGQGLGFQGFWNEFRQSSMFREKKLFILKNVFSNEEFKSDILKNKKILLDQEEIIIFFEENKVLESDSLTKFLKKNGKFQKFELLKPLLLKKWVQDEFARKGKETELAAIEKLADFVGNDLWQMENEINKLSSFREKGKITVEDITLLVRPKIETEIFQTIDALSQGNKKRAMALIEKHLEKGNSPFYLLSMISYQYRTLILAKIGAGRQFGVKPYPLRKAIALTRNISLEKLKKIHQDIFRTDLKIKTGEISPEKGIKTLVAEL